MAAPGVNGKLLVALSKYGSMKPAALIKQLQEHADHVVQCSALPCDAPLNPSAPYVCDLVLQST
jgi:hypothetical protein